LTPLPGSKLAGGHLEPNDFSVTPEGAPKSEVIATGYIRKWYARPDGLTNALFNVEYGAALTKAGWEIVSQSNSSNGGIVAHYTQQGRNVWTHVFLAGSTYEFQVADVGANDLAKAFSTDCHVALYGVLFDFNKATLQPVSEPVLQQVRALLKKSASLKVEVQGHTDNVGDDAYNQTLSEARASSVVAWLTQHGIAADRLTVKGYGKTKPIADNGNDEGRARNRRVEIADPRCVPKGK